MAKTTIRQDAEAAWNDHYMKAKEAFEILDLEPWMLSGFRNDWIARWMIAHIEDYLQHG